MNRPPPNEQPLRNESCPSHIAMYNHILKINQMTQTRVVVALAKRTYKKILYRSTNPQLSLKHTNFNLKYNNPISTLKSQLSSRRNQISNQRSQLSIHRSRLSTQTTQIWFKNSPHPINKRHLGLNKQPLWLKVTRWSRKWNRLARKNSTWEKTGPPLH